MENDNLKTIISGYIQEIDKRVENKILEQSNADLLKKLINKAESITEAHSIAALGTTYKRTGFYFDKKLEKYDETIKYFKKNTDLSFKTSADHLTHKLIIGDNYPSLLNLLIEYKNKIDVIYIDPPYGKDSMGEFAETNYNNAITRDNLLSMLYPRLQLAKQLLSNTGVIFCSIDDKNHAYVKCLFDEVFGERNFIANINILDNLKGKENDNFISLTSHYILSYAKHKPTKEEWGFNKVINNEESLESKYNLIDKSGNNYTTNTFKKTGAGKNREDRPSMFYPIIIRKNTNNFECILDDEYKNIYKNSNFDDNYLKNLHNKYKNTHYFILPIDNKGLYLRWTSTFETYKTLIKNNHLIFNNDNQSILQKKYPKDIEIISNSIYGTPKNFVYKKEFSKGTNDLTDILENVCFDNPKSVALIKYILSLIPNNNSTVLDFFAGSGTTGQAVLELNKEDGGNRQFILCTNNEKTDKNPNGIAYDVTSKRLKRVMTGKCYDGTDNFKWLETNKSLGNNLDVYEIKEVANNENTENKTPFDVIDETLYGENKLTNTTDKIMWVVNNFENTQKHLE